MDNFLLHRRTCVLPRCARVAGGWGVRLTPACAPASDTPIAGSSDSGQLISIDFGHSFGSATTILPVPELIPFRLSRLMTQVMAPYGNGGLYEHTMVHTLTRTRCAERVAGPGRGVLISSGR